MSSRHFIHYAVNVNNADKSAILKQKKGSPRSFLLIENRSGFDVFVNFDMVASTLDGIKIANNAERLFDQVVPDNEIHVTGSQAADQRVNITEAY